MLLSVGYVETTEFVDTIKSQIGHKAFYMIGATKFYAMDTYTLRFNVMKNKSKANYIEVKYNIGFDDYTMTFLKLTNSRVDMKNMKIIPATKRIIKEVNGLFFDQLCSTIEENTGLYTKLF